MDMKLIEALEDNTVEKNWVDEYGDYIAEVEKNKVKSFSSQIDEISKKPLHYDDEKHDYAFIMSRGKPMDRRTQEQKFQEKVIEMFEELRSYSDSYSLDGMINELKEIVGKDE